MHTDQLAITAAHMFGLGIQRGDERYIRSAVRGLAGGLQFASDEGVASTVAILDGLAGRKHGATARIEDGRKQDAGHDAHFLTFSDGDK